MNKGSKSQDRIRGYPALPSGGLTIRHMLAGSWVFFFALSAGAQTNAAAAPLVAPSLPNAGVSFLRVMGALALVIGIFLGGVWLFKNWQRLAIQRGRAPKLNIIESRSLGGRHSIFVVGYEQERFLISSSPGGVNLLSHLPTAAGNEINIAAGNPSVPTFTQALAHVLKAK
ncbi:MAG TPA: flagellar biosynthetic protein FliO [Candidatus Acidoferrales bacterium]|jgi:flagellar biogenesis protein FliO|nr:flagellar biosynthetic protein FliO [Candidatus Acidoferrales bacterium]